MRAPHDLAFVPRQYQSDRVLESGDALITEISGAFWGYSGQIHRTFFLGEPTDAWARLHGAAEEAYAAIESVLRDGATIDQVLDAAEVIDRSGYTIFDDLLHGANQYPPIIKTRSTAHSNPPGDFTFRSGMVITIQPQLTTHDRTIGLQYGETVVIRPDGVERLHRYPREMIVVRA
jgi:Xaa-Pro aminopeptidase